MSAFSPQPAGIEATRMAMVASQLRTNAVNDPRVVTAMTQIARERFLPGVDSALAYRDTAVSLGQGREANLPLATGRLLTEAYLRATDRVLLIGAGGGYAAAVLARIVAAVVAVESDADLAAHARAALSGVANVTVIEDAMAAGHAEGAPYDVLIVDGAIPAVPEPLWSQVAIGGRVVAGIIDRGVTRLASGVRAAHGVALVDFVDCECVLLPGFSRPAKFVF